MAEIIPFRAWRYHNQFGSSMHNLLSPMQDTQSTHQNREKLYQNPLNSIHLTPLKVQDKKDIESLKGTLDQWKHSNILIQDEKPGIYVYYQYFTLPHSKKRWVSKGFIAQLKIDDDTENGVLGHEMTLSKTLDLRVQLLDTLQANIIPTHGIYTDSQQVIEKYMEESIKTPLIDTEDTHGFRHVLSVIHDGEIIEKFKNVLQNQKIILADGHHRYESALKYRQIQKKLNTNHNGNEGYNFNMMYFSNSESSDLTVLPTHRIIFDLKNYQEALFLEKLSQYFKIEKTHAIREIPTKIHPNAIIFGLITQQEQYKLTFKNPFLQDRDWDISDELKNLNVSILHYFIIEKCLQIALPDQEKLQNIRFETQIDYCIEKRPPFQLAILTQPLSFAKIRNVCISNHVLPQKSSYFFPKVACGLLFSSLDNK